MGAGQPIDPQVYIKANSKPEQGMNDPNKAFAQASKLANALDDKWAPSTNNYNKNGDFVTRLALLTGRDLL